MKFTELTLDERVMKGIADAGFTDCTPVQEQTFQYTLEGKDVLVQSQTGTGKTAAFLITIFQNFLSGQREGTSLVVVPTRELAVQIEEEAKLLGSHTGMRIVSVYGGVGYNQQEELLAKGVDLLIGTPGRLLDFGKSRKIRFDEVKNCVIDEADRMFDMGFYPDIRMMMKKMPSVVERQTMLFSATLSTRVRNLAWEYMNSPGEIEISPENLTVELITQELYHVSKNEKLKLLLGILKKENPENCLIFANTKYMAVELAWRLSENGYKCQYLMGDLPQKKRLQVIERVKAGEIQFLVATDVAARGLHIDDLSMVVNYDIPEDFENYVHRIGRTARAGKSGKAITFACEKYVYGLEAIEEYIKMKIPVLWAGEELFGEDVTAGKPFHNPDKDYIRRNGDRDRGRGRDQGRGRSGGSRTGGRPGERPRRERDRSGERAERPRASYAFKGRPAAPAEQAPHKEERRPRRGQPQERRGEGMRKPSPNAPMEERLAYYRSKYGEDFKPSDLPGAVKEGDSGKRRKQYSGGQGDSRKKNQDTRRQGSRNQDSRGGKPGETRKPNSYPKKPNSYPKKPNSYPMKGKGTGTQAGKPAESSKKPGFFERLKKRFRKDAE